MVCVGGTCQCPSGTAPIGASCPAGCVPNAFCDGCCGRGWCDGTGRCGRPRSIDGGTCSLPQEFCEEQGDGTVDPPCCAYGPNPNDPNTWKTWGHCVDNRCCHGVGLYVPGECRVDADCCQIEGSPASFCVTRSAGGKVCCGGSEVGLRCPADCAPNAPCDACCDGFCGGDRLCAPNCPSGDEACGGRCHPPCPLGQVREFRSGACRCVDCPPGTTRCLGECVDTANDTSNCGACGSVCPECPPGQIAYGSVGWCGCWER